MTGWNRDPCNGIDLLALGQAFQRLPLNPVLTLENRHRQIALVHLVERVPRGIDSRNKALGARVIAVVSKAEKAAEIKHINAEHILALSGAPLAEQVQAFTDGKGADLVLDPVGGESDRRSALGGERPWPAGPSRI